MKDEIVIASAMHNEVRIHCARSTAMVNAARIAHTCMPTSIAALGRTMTAAAIMASDLKKPDEKITAVINGHGPAGTILVQAKGNGEVRGFIGDPNLYAVRADGHLDVGGIVGTNGTLTVTKDLGLKEPYVGVSRLQSGEIGDDFTYYFAISEQVPSVVGVGVLVDPDGSVSAAGGLIYQLMPGASEETISYCEKTAAHQKPVTELMSSGLTLEEIILMYFPDAQILEHKDIRWHCGCSKEHYGEALMTLQTTDLQEMIDDGQGAEITCQYCSSKYNFTPAEIKVILENKQRVEDR